MMPAFNYGQSYGYSGNNAYSYNFGDSNSSNQAQSTQNAQSLSESFRDPGRATQWAQGYQDYLNSHSNLYAASQSGYQDVLGRVGNQANAVTEGYGNLGRQVDARLQGIDSSRRQEINDAYAKERGNQQQSLASRGLGNTTVTSAVDRGLTLDREKALNQLSGQTAQMQAGYMGQFGSAGLGAQQQLLGQYGQLGGQNMAGQAAYLMNPLGWDPNSTRSTSTSTGQSTSSGQSVSHNQGESWNMGQSMNESMNYGSSGQPNRAQPTQYYPPSGGGYYPPPSSIGTPYSSEYTGGTGAMAGYDPNGGYGTYTPQAGNQYYPSSGANIYNPPGLPVVGVGGVNVDQDGNGVTDNLPGGGWGGVPSYGASASASNPYGGSYYDPNTRQWKSY